MAFGESEPLIRTQTDTNYVLEKRQRERIGRQTSLCKEQKHKDYRTRSWTNAIRLYLRLFEAKRHPRHRKRHRKRQKALVPRVGAERVEQLDQMMKQIKKILELVLKDHQENPENIQNSKAARQQQEDEAEGQQAASEAARQKRQADVQRQEAERDEPQRRRKTKEDKRLRTEAEQAKKQFIAEQQKLLDVENLQLTLQRGARLAGQSSSNYLSVLLSERSQPALREQSSSRPRLNDLLHKSKFGRTSGSQSIPAVPTPQADVLTAVTGLQSSSGSSGLAQTAFVSAKGTVSTLSAKSASADLWHIDSRVMANSKAVEQFGQTHNTSGKHKSSIGKPVRDSSGMYGTSGARGRQSRGASTGADPNNNYLSLSSDKNQHQNQRKRHRQEADQKPYKTDRHLSKNKEVKKKGGSILSSSLSEKSNSLEKDLDSFSDSLSINNGFNNSKAISKKAINNEKPVIKNEIDLQTRKKMTRFNDV